MENTNIQRNINNDDTIDVRELIFKYLRRWYWFALSVLFCFFIAFIYIEITTPEYQVKSALLLRNNDKKSFDIPELAFLSGGSITGSGEIEDEVLVLSSKTLVGQVVHELDLKTEYWKKDGMRYLEMYKTSPVLLKTSEFFNDSIQFPINIEIEKSSKGYNVTISSRVVTGATTSANFKKEISLTSLDNPIETPFGALKLMQIANFEGDIKIVAYPSREIINRYLSEITVAPARKKSKVLDLTLTTPTPQKGQDFLNYLADVYDMDIINDKNMIAYNTAEFIDERLRLIGTELLDEEIRVEAYKKDHTLTDISSQTKLYLEASSDYNKRLAEIETQLNLSSHIETHIKNDENKYALIPANIGIEDASLTSLVREYNNALLERMKLLRTTQEQNPVIIQLEQQLSLSKANILTSIQSIKDGLNIALNDIKRKEDQFLSKMRQVPTQERQFLEIVRQQQIKETLYLFLLQKREENALTLASTASSLKIIDTAYTDGVIVSPKVMIVFLIALALGLIIPLGLIFVFDIMNNTIENKAEFIKLVKAPFLGSIAQGKTSDAIVVKEGRTTSVVEMFRMIRTNVGFMLSSKKSSSILVTSSVSGEGKTFISINLSMSFALMKKRVILLGLDIRNPMLGDYLQVPKDSGVTVFLSDDSYTIDDVIIPSGVHPNLDVIPAGPVPPNPAELLLNERLDMLVEALRERYDYILIDSAPLGIVTDTLLLNRLADMCIYVARQDYTTKNACDLINDMYNTKKLNNMSVVLNGIDEAASTYGYNKYTKYRYNRYRYNYIYHRDDKPKDTFVDKIKKLFTKR
jgi:capsular exopolysaccharide synthesis family protein